MKKVVVFIGGTNAVGKTTLAKYIIEKCGGIKQTGKEATQLNDGVTSFVGPYGGGIKYQGCDYLNETKNLEAIIGKELETRSIVFAEGFYIHSFGLNLQRAILKGEKQLFVFLYAPIEELNRRTIERSGLKLTMYAIHTQKCTLNAAKKYAQIGIPVLSFDTSKKTVEQIGDEILSKVEQLQK